MLEKAKNLQILEEIIPLTFRIGEGHVPRVPPRGAAYGCGHGKERWDIIMSRFSRHNGLGQI